MTSFDMTWKCDIKSNDEIGVFANCINYENGIDMLFWLQK